MEKNVLILCLFLAVLGSLVLICSSEEQEESLVRGVRAADRSKSTNGTASHKGKGGSTAKPASTARSGKATTRKSFANNQRPRAPITGKPVDGQQTKSKPKTLSPLLAPRNPKHRTTTTTTEEPEFEEDEEELED